MYTVRNHLFVLQSSENAANAGSCGRIRQKRNMTQHICGTYIKHIIAIHPNRVFERKCVHPHELVDQAGGAESLHQPSSALMKCSRANHTESQHTQTEQLSCGELWRLHSCTSLPGCMCMCVRACACHFYSFISCLPCTTDVFG